MNARRNDFLAKVQTRSIFRQDFLEAALPKIEQAREEIDRHGLSVEVEVDGGINERTGPRCLAAGATVLAAASSIFKAKDPGQAARRLADLTGR